MTEQLTWTGVDIRQDRPRHLLTLIKLTVDGQVIRELWMGVPIITGKGGVFMTSRQYKILPSRIPQTRYWKRLASPVCNES